MRRLIYFIIGLVIIAIAVFVAMNLIKNKKKKVQRVPQKTNIVYVNVVKNNEIPIVVTTSGELNAKNKIELFSEVQGIFKMSNKDFKAGTSYRKGEVILRINSDEHYANLQSLKSNFYNSITSIMPDIRLDYPDEFQKWEQYLLSIDINKLIPKLPETSSDQEKFFISGKNIFSNYYNVKNQEVRLSKYRIIAPFSGTLTEAFVNPGTLVRQGQKLGEFINPDVFELNVSVKSEYSDLLKVGKTVTLNNIEKTETWTGKVVRVNSKIEQMSQTISVFIQVRGKGLKEGMYLEADLIAKSEKNAFEINRKLLIDDDKLYSVSDSVLELITIEPLYFNKNTVVVRGLQNGTKVLSKALPGAYSGMVVEIFSGEKKGKKSDKN